MQAMHDDLTLYRIIAMKFQSARKAAQILNIEGPLGSLEQNFRPFIATDALRETFDLLYLELYGASLLNYLHPDYSHIVYIQN